MDKKTMFGWYLDNEEKKLQPKLTVIILFSNTKSKMQILTKDRINYKGQGTTIIFS